MQVVVNTKPGCPSCDRVKSFLTGRNVPFTILVHETQAERDAIYDAFGLEGDAARTMPQVVIIAPGQAPERIGGYEQTLVSGIGNRYHKAMKALQPTA